MKFFFYGYDMKKINYSRISFNINFYLKTDNFGEQKYQIRNILFMIFKSCQKKIFFFINKTLKNMQFKNHTACLKSEKFFTLENCRLYLYNLGSPQYQFIGIHSYYHLYR